MKEPQGKKEYYAKSNPLILNKDHLAEVGKLAERYGEEIGRKEEGGLAGRLHDFGKYSDRFQGVLLGDAPRDRPRRWWGGLFVLTEE